MPHKRPEKPVPSGIGVVTRCWCDNGLALLPHQALKFDTVAGFPERGWALPRGQLLIWLAQRTGPR